MSLWFDRRFTLDFDGDRMPPARSGRIIDRIRWQRRHRFRLSLLRKLLNFAAVNPSSKMNRLFKLALAAAVVAPLSIASATAGDAGPAAGTRLPAFTVEKVAGAESDGVPTGKSLCYRCKNGARPQVVVFTRSADAKVAELVKKLDAAVAAHKADDLKVFVNVLNSDVDAAKKTAAKMAQMTGAKNIPFVVPSDHATGPRNYKLGDGSLVITMANDSKVTGNVTANDAAEIDVDSVLAKVEAML